MKALGWIMALSCAVAAFGADTAYKGYLCDRACAEAGKGAMDGADLKTNPGEHTVACQVACAKSGYGILMKDGMAFKFVPFTGKGDELAASLLKTTTKLKGVYVEATGEMKDGSLMVSALKESEM